ncbi:MAG: LysR family transcriptional regulator [Pigmentiphaga sp.]|nr:LysR family transcriptional regulator [Pigmentiphaga sp.]
MLDTNLLRCFLAVLEHRKLTTAAEALFLTQPALSKSLRRLEEELGVPLFTRTPTGMVPTSYGIALGRRARLIDLESRQAREELRVLREGGAGSITIGIGPLWSAYGIPEAVTQLVAKRSKMHVRIVSGVLDTLIPQLLKGELDVVCSALDFPDHPELLKRHLFDTVHLMMAHESHPLGQLSHVPPARLLEFPLVGLDKDYAGLDRLEKFFIRNGLQSPGVAIEASSLETLFSLLMAGSCIASVSSQLLGRAAQLNLRPLAVPGELWRFQSGLIYRRATDMDSLAGGAISAIAEQLTEV